MEVSAKANLSEEDQYYIDIMRGVSILRVVLAHLGLSWFYPPYSQYIGIFLPVLFFVSGAVSYFSFSRSASITEYLLKRVTLIAVPFYVFAIIVILLTFLFYSENVPDLLGAFRWLVIWPDFGSVFFPLNQIWFINALVAMVLISSFLFSVSRSTGVSIFVYIAFVVGVSVANSFFPLYEIISTWPPLTQIKYAHQFWQVSILSLFFFYGAIHYQYFSLLKSAYCAVIGVAFFVLAIICYFLFDLDFDMSGHIATRSIYFIFLAMAGIYLFLAVKRPLMYVLEKVSFLKWLVLYTNRYAYSIFLLHTLVLYCVENAFGLKDLSENLPLALLRMFLVLIFTFIIAKPLGESSRFVAHYVRSKLL